MFRQAISYAGSEPLHQQLDLLTEIQKSGDELGSALASLGISYNDLRYEVANKRAWNGPKPQGLGDVKKVGGGVPFVSFFTGCGGVDLGFEAAGLVHDASFEINELFCKTLRRNRPQWHVFGPPIHSGDVSDLDAVVETLSSIIQTPYDGVFVGGPPCQPFSIAANQRFSRSGDNFKRVGFAHERNGSLLFDFVKIIQQFRPAVFVIENVPGLRDIDGGEQLSLAIASLTSVGYRVESPIDLNAANYGVPQNRHRLFVVGNRLSKPFHKPKVTGGPIGCGSVLTMDEVTAANHETREHRLGSVLRYCSLNYGERDQLGRVDRLDPTLPSKTVIAGGVNGGRRSHLHPEIPRTLSVRECARLQTFPDDFVFVGATARQFTQVGNAVPPVLAAQIGAAIVGSYF